MLRRAKHSKVEVVAPKEEEEEECMCVCIVVMCPIQILSTMMEIKSQQFFNCLSFK